jgi:4-amino-4-deoxy-L-arabinose transferase-like glycosyltransferase
MRRRNWVILLGLWLVSVLCDRLWFALDQSVPSWDPAEYLTQSLEYWQALQQPQWFSGGWWTQLWQVTTKSAPFTFLATAPVLSLFGLPHSTLVNLLFSAVLLGSIYGLGAHLLNPRIGLWAAGLCLLLPELYRIRLDYLLDYPLVAMVTLSFFCLTRWRDSKTPQQGWGWAGAFGVALGLTLLTKQTGLFFLFLPMLWLGVGCLRQRDWGRLAQLFTAVLLSIIFWGPWYSINWLLILTSSKRATIDSAIAEGDPGLNTLGAWTYYWQKIPQLVSWPLLLVPIVAILLFAWRNQRRTKPGLSFRQQDLAKKHTWSWLAVFIGGAYLLNSLNINKDPRYIVPCLPVIALLLAYGLTLLPERWRGVRWGTVGLAVLLAIFNLFPVGGGIGDWLTGTLTPYSQHQIYRGTKLPHREVIQAVVEAQPYLRSNIGVLPSTPRINQHNFSYFGALANFQVFGRQVGTVKQQVEQDARSLDWFITKTGGQGSIRSQIASAQQQIVQTVSQSPDFQHRDWSLPDGSVLQLFQRRSPPIQVSPSPTAVGSQVQLIRVQVPEQIPPGMPVPITYEWSGPWQELQQGIALLTWTLQSAETNQPSTGNHWFHDHGIALGNLMAGGQKIAPDASFQVAERLAMRPTAGLPDGRYVLQGIYLNRKSGVSYPLSMPVISVQLSSKATAIAAPELDLISQFREYIPGFRQGKVEPLFAFIGRIHQYDPIQDYLIPLEQSVKFRLQQNPNDLDLLYTLTFVQALKRKPEIVQTCERLTQLDAANPYAWIYAGIVHLYFGQPGRASTDFDRAASFNPPLKELRLLRGAAALLQLRLPQAWELLRSPV